MPKFKFNKRQLEQIKYERCAKHPTRKFSINRKPGPTKLYPTGCPVCVEIWEAKAKEAEPDEAEKARIKEENRKKTAHLRKFHKENPDVAKKAGFQKGQSGDDQKTAKELHEVIKSKTRGGGRIVDRLVRLAQLHPQADKNIKGVSHQQQLAALRELLARGFGPVLDPDAKDEKEKGVTINILNLKGTSFEDYQKMVDGKVEVKVTELSPAGLLPEKSSD